jgi:hypothetical protein
VPKTHRTRVSFESVQRHLESRAGVDRVAVNRSSGSILVEGDQNEPLRSALKEVLEIFEQSETPEDAAKAGVEVAVSLVQQLDERLMEMTDNKVTLRWLVPAAFISVGIRQLFAQGFTLGGIPWFVLIYYGVDSFLKLYPEYAPERGSAQLKVLSETE